MLNIDVYDIIITPAAMTLQASSPYRDLIIKVRVQTEQKQELSDSNFRESKFYDEIGRQITDALHAYAGNDPMSAKRLENYVKVQTREGAMIEEVMIDEGRADRFRKEVYKHIIRAKTQTISSFDEYKTMIAALPAGVIVCNSDAALKLSAGDPDHDGSMPSIQYWKSPFKDVRIIADMLFPPENLQIIHIADDPAMTVTRLKTTAF